MKIIKTESLYKTKFIELIKTQYENTKGTLCDWFYVTRPNTKDIVMIAPIINHNGEDKLVMIKEYRVPIEDYEYGFPAGLVDEGETIEEAIHRELKEETGLDVLDIREITRPLYNSAGLTDESICISFVYAGGEITTKHNEDSEEIEVLLLNKSQVEDIMDDMNLKIGAKAWLIMEMFLMTKNHQLEGEVI
ncbi:MAG: NUDIX domain-containing protein [bacterium]